MSLRATAIRTPARRLWPAAVCLAAIASAVADAQRPIPLPAGPIRHHFHSLERSPGFVGQQQLLRVPNAAGYFQPVEVRGPEGSLISLAGDGGFLPPHQQRLKVGLQMGRVYRFRVGNIPLLEGFEVFPTVELINRLHPPPGMEAKFPVPVELTREELEMAIKGNLVTRVIYVEDPGLALGVPEAGEQRYFDVDRRLDPLQMADRLGRPIAILRMGSRVPLGDEQFEEAAAPAVVYPEVVDARLDPAPAAEGPDAAAAPAAPGGEDDSDLAPPASPAAAPATRTPAGGAVAPAALRQPGPARYPRLPHRYEIGDSTPRPAR